MAVLEARCASKKEKGRRGMERSVFAKKALQLFVIVAVIIFIILSFRFAVRSGEIRECETWRSHPELWVGWRIDQCEDIGVPLQVTP